MLLLLLPLQTCRKITLKDTSHIRTSGEKWPLFGGDIRRTHRRDARVAPPLKQLWTHKASAAVSPALVAVDGLLYFATMDGRVEAIEIATGRRIGKANALGNYEATCAYGQKDLIIASRYGSETLGKYDLHKGEYVWRVDAGDIASEPLVNSDWIWVAALYNHVDQYDLETGNRMWTFKTADQVRSSPAMSQNSVIVGCDSGALYSIHAHDGTLNWELQIGGSILATPMIWQDLVYVGSLDSSFYAVDSKSGRIVWKFRAKTPLRQSAATDGEVLFFGASNGEFFCLDRATGEEQWRFEVESGVSTAPLISGDVVYFGSLDRHYYCLDIKTGKELWKFETRGRIRTSPILWQKYILGASEDRYVYAFVQAKPGSEEPTL